MTLEAFDIDEFIDLRDRLSKSLGISVPELNRMYSKVQTGVSKHPPLQSDLTLTPASMIPERKIEWIWNPFIPEAKVSCLVGDPGLGKSLIAAMIAAKISARSNWPLTGFQAPYGEVIILSGEDDPNDTITPRLRASGANLDHVHILEPIVKNRKSRNILFSINDDILKLEERIDALDCKLVVIDPISAFTGEVNNNSNTEVRTLMFRLKTFAERTGVAVLCVTHFAKGETGRSPVNRVMGSLAWSAAARSVFGVVKDRDDSQRRLLLPVKNNIAKDHGGFAYRIGEDKNGIACLEFEPDQVFQTFEEIAGSVPRYGEKMTEAQDLLVEMLANGGKWQTDIQNVANKRGISSATLRRAKCELGVISDQAGGKWIWSLPKDSGDHSHEQ